MLIICNSASGLHDFRGMLIQKLLQGGNNVSAIIPVSEIDSELAAEKALEALKCNLIRLPMERRGMNPISDSKLLFSYRKVIKKCNPQLVITYTIKPNIYGGIACQLLKVPYAANITGLGTAFQNDGILRKFVTILYRIAFRKAKVVFFENTGNRDTIIDAGIVKKEKTYVLNGAGVDLEKFSCQEYPSDANEIRFLFIGRIMKEKGIDELFSAMSKLVENNVNCSLDVLGGYEESYQDIIKECEAAGWLHYHGYQKDVRPFINKVHCFVLPSWHEGMANTNLECASSGRPVITTRIPGCMEAVIDRKSGFLVEKKNVDDLYRKMKMFCQLSNSERKAMGLAGRKHMEEIFDKQKVVADTIKKLNEN